MDCSEIKGIIVAVDGYSSCGKSTFARLVASRKGYLFIDTGAMYRAVTLYAIEHNMASGNEVDDPADLIAELDNIDIAFRFNPQIGASDIYLNGRSVEGAIRTVTVSNLVSAVSRIPEVRTKLVAMQQAMGRSGGVVMDGRDIGTVVFPDAELKIFMVADPKVRAQRRFDELRSKGDSNITFEDVEQNLTDRDYKDEHRAVSPLRRADDAIVLDNSSMTIDQELEWFDRIFASTIERCRQSDRHNSSTAER